MAKKKKTDGAGPPAEGRAGGHKHKAIGLRPPPEVLEAIERVQRKRQFPSVAYTSLILIKDALQALGELPEEGGA